jgi:hypothetical protein
LAANPKFVGLIDHCFDPQYAPMLVVHFYPVAFQPMFNSSSLPAMLEVTEDLALEVPVEFTTEKGHDILGAEAHRGVPQQLCIQALQRSAVLEQNVRGIFRLVNYPIVGKSAQKFMQMRIGPAGYGAEDARPILVRQPVGKTLGALRIAQANKGIVQALVSQAVAVHLARQPFMPVEINLDHKGKPCLQSHMHQAKNPINEIEVKTQTSRIGGYQPRPMLSIAKLKTGRLLDGAQHTDKPLRNSITSCNGRYLFFFTGGTIQIDIRTPSLLSQVQPVVLDGLRTGQRKGFEIFEQNPLLPKESFHRSRLAERQVTFEDHPIKTG